MIHREDYSLSSPQGKEVATQIKVLPPGSVLFDDVAEEDLQGAVRQPVIRSFTHGRGKEPEPIIGEIIYQNDIDGYVKVFVTRGQPHPKYKGN